MSFATRRKHRRKCVNTLRRLYNPVDPNCAKEMGTVVRWSARDCTRDLGRWTSLHLPWRWSNRWTSLVDLSTAEWRVSYDIYEPKHSMFNVCILFAILFADDEPGSGVNVGIHGVFV